MKAIIVLFVFFLMVLNIQAQQWTPEDIINTEYVSNPIFSPTGDMVIWSKRTGLKKEDKFVNKLFLTRLNILEKGKPLTIQLTRGESSESNPVFSKDGKDIYFLSSKDEGKKLWKLSVYGGEAQEVHEFEHGISNIKWLNEEKIAFVSNDGKSLYQQKYEEKKDNTKVIEDSLHWPSKRLYAFDLGKKIINRLTENSHQITSYDVSEDGRYAVIKQNMSPHYPTDGQPKPQVILYDFEGNNSTLILKDFKEPGNFKFIKDGEGFYFFALTTSDPKWNIAGKNELYFYDIEESQYSKVPLDWDNGAGYSFYAENDWLILPLANGPLRKVGLYKEDEDDWRSLNIDFEEMQEHVSILAMSADNKIIFEYSTASKLPQYFVGRLAIKNNKARLSEAVEFISLNNNIKKKPTANSEVIYWQGANGDEVNGILYYPKHYEKGKKYPLILSIHGGPTGVDQDIWRERWSTYPQIYTDKGAFVLKPNYHGSGLHGQEFAESIKKGKYYELDQIDIFNGIQHLNKLGLIDMDRLGTMGWSNGAILTTWLTLKYPDMFRVAAPGAGDINWTSDYGTCRFGVTFDQYYFGGAPWDDTNGKHFNEWYINNSPLFDIEKIKTPTIIFHGSKDRAVPRDQGWEYYRGLQQVGKAPVKFFWFPDQPHGLRKITHQLRKMKEEIKWIDKYLFGKDDSENEALKDDSPIAYAIQKTSMKKEGNFYGVLVNNQLIPETHRIKKDSIAISCFELTNVQYASYHSDHKYPDGKDNFPVTGLAKSDIEGYLGWINKLTGEKYRLPNQKEAQEFHKKAKDWHKEENTLNHWAGYTLTPKDANALLSKIEDQDLDLLKEVGSHKPQKVGEAFVYDLVGNVAEYAVTENDLVKYGFDAHTFVDTFNMDDNNSKLIGVRLIRQ
ncbi:MAG TPA: prolyl oligopeptidase family serine peptidase [Cyclobacteriaceae bacterium]